MSMAIQGYEGLDIPYRANLRRPVHIVRQTISNLETQISSLSAYHNYEGLSSIPQYRRESRRINHIPIGIYKPYIWGMGAMWICGLKVWKNFGLESLVFLFWKLAPRKSMIENQKYKIVKGAR